MPGLVNAHFHSPGNLMKGCLDGLPLEFWQNKEPKLLERDLTRSRARTGIDLVNKRGAARSLVRGLHEKRTIVLLPDQAVRPSEGILVPFLG